MTDAIIFSLSRALTILPVHKMPLGLQKSEFLYLFEEKLTSMYIFYLWEYTQWVVSLELSGECVWKGFYLLSYLLSFFLLLLSFLFSSAWRGFMQWVVSLELPGVCVCGKVLSFYLFIFFLLFIFYLHGEVLCIGCVT